MTGRARKAFAFPMIPGLLLAVVCAGLLPAKDLGVVLSAGPYRVEARIDRNPPRVGENALAVEITDGDGRPFTSGRVLINYYMPPMPRMPPMNYKKEARLKKEKYRLDLSFIMAGPWFIVIKIADGEKTETAKFRIDVQ
jgi:hypothetical protein